MARQAHLTLSLAPRPTGARHQRQARRKALQRPANDINVPGRLDGWDVAKRARELRPDIPVIYMTGLAADDWASRGVPNSLLLQKPFALAQIVTAVAQMLNTESPNLTGANRRPIAERRGGRPTAAGERPLLMGKQTASNPRRCRLMTLAV